jgi:2-C-methyl-D-erythritol 2,4-cyclodiphosphate synthase
MAMRERLAHTLQIPVDRIGLKATTNEGLGFIGQGEGIAAMAVVSLEKVEPRFPAESPGALV